LHLPHMEWRWVYRLKRACGQIVVVAMTVSSMVDYAHAEIPATVVILGDISEAGALDAARGEMSASWRLAHLVPPAGNEAPPPDESQSLARSYFDADFLRCLTKLQSPSLDVDHLLERDRHDEAARAGTLAAACALGAGDKPRARELVRRLFVRGLEDPDTLRQTTPEFQTLVDDERTAVRRLSWVTIDVQTNPDRAAVHIDGVLRCRSAPCRVHVIGGEHIVRAEKLGRRSRAVSVELDEDQRVTLALDEAPADDVRRDLLSTLAAGMDPTGIEVSQAAATAFGARVVVLVWAERGSVHATSYDRAPDKMIAHVAIDAGPDAVPAAVRAAVREERGIAGPKPIVKQPLFWLTVAGVALLSGTIVLMTNRPVEVQHDIVFH
jgi:hypothetical protein